MALEDILRALEQECNETVTEIKKKANLQSENIIEDAKDKAQQAEEEAIEKEKRKIKQQSSQVVNDARIKARKVVSEAKEEAIDEVMKNIEKTLVENQNWRRSFLRKALVEAMESYEGDTNPLVYTNKEDLENVKNLLSEMEFTGEVQTGNSFKAGVVVSDSEGRISIRGTVDSLMNRIRKNYRANINSRLFGDA